MSATLFCSWSAGSVAGIRVMLLVRERCPCGGPYVLCLRRLVWFGLVWFGFLGRVLKFEVQHPASYKVLLWKNDTNNSSLKSG